MGSCNRNYRLLKYLNMEKAEQFGRLSSSISKPAELLFDNDCTTIFIWVFSVHCRNNIFILFCKDLSCNFYIALVVLFWPDSFGFIKKMGNEKDFDFRVRSKENMVMILVRKRSAVMPGLRRFLRMPGCQFDTWLTSVVWVGIKEREHNPLGREV